MTDQLYLLSDRQMQQFIVSGYLTVRADYPASFHDEIYWQVNAVQQEGNVGNNLLPRIPQIGRVFEHPAVAGALTSLLGPRYILNPHRHAHLNPPGRSGQGWHKDCYVFDHNFRHPRFYWVLAFYYPQDTTEDMGPSGILPSTQIFKTISDDDPAKTREEALSLCGPAGTVALVHFDSWHRATENVSDKKRYMLKFQFARMQEPVEPTWDHRNRAWSPGIVDSHPDVSRDVWDWLCGKKNCSADSDEYVSEWRAMSEDETETRLLNVAYALARTGQKAVPELISAMREQALSTFDETTAKTSDNFHGTNPTLGPAATALTAVGSSAVPALIEVLAGEHWWVRAVAAGVLARMGGEAVEAVPALVTAMRDEHWWVRRNAIEPVGMIGACSDHLVSKLAKALGDEEYRVRLNAALTLAKIGTRANSAVPALIPVLHDENRYTRFYAALALRRIDTPQSLEALSDSLFESRWCPMTTKDDLY